MKVICGSIVNDSLARQLFEIAHPFNSYYFSNSPTNPKEVFGFGEWNQITGRFLRMMNSSGEGGSESFTLTADQMPSHSHTHSHTHKGPSHVHTGPSHTHNGPSHTHTGPSHTHTVSGTAASAGSHQHKGVHSYLYNATGSVTWKEGSGTVNYLKATPTSDYLVASAGSHTHTVSGTAAAAGTGSTGASGTGATSAAGTGNTGYGGDGNTSDASTTSTSTVGGSKAVTHLPPYRNVYAWIRVA